MTQGLDSAYYNCAGFFLGLDGSPPLIELRKSTTLPRISSLLKTHYVPHSIFSSAFWNLGYEHVQAISLTQHLSLRATVENKTCFHTCRKMSLFTLAVIIF